MFMLLDIKNTENSREIISFVTWSFNVPHWDTVMGVSFDIYKLLNGNYRHP